MELTDIIQDIINSLKNEQKSITLNNIIEKFKNEKDNQDFFHYKNLFWYDKKQLVDVIKNEINKYNENIIIQIDDLSFLSENIISNKPSYELSPNKLSFIEKELNSFLSSLQLELESLSSFLENYLILKWKNPEKLMLLRLKELQEKPSILEEFRTFVEQNWTRYNLELLDLYLTNKENLEKYQKELLNYWLYWKIEDLSPLFEQFLEKNNFYYSKYSIDNQKEFNKNFNKKIDSYIISLNDEFNSFKTKYRFIDFDYFEERFISLLSTLKKNLKKNEFYELQSFRRKSICLFNIRDFDYIKIYINTHMTDFKKFYENKIH